LPARIVMTTGNDFITEMSANEAATVVARAPGPYVRFQATDGDATRAVFVFPPHVAYVEDVVERRSAYEERGAVSG
jgi:hypothetical protein